MRRGGSKMFSHFFIERPIFASVLSIVIFLAGVVSVATLPVAQYPPITPPTINVQCTATPAYAAQDVADSVAAPIEQQINGVEGMMYMVSQSNNDGSYNLTVTFKPGVNLNFAQISWCRIASTWPCRTCPTSSSRPASSPASATRTSCSSWLSTRKAAAMAAALPQ